MNTTIQAVAPNHSTVSAAARERILGARGEPLFYADWVRTVFVHFEVDAEALQREVPFALDLRAGRAFVSLVAFTMRDMRPRLGGKIGVWLFRPIGNHSFLNVRAYVKHRGEAGIYFLAEWMDNPLSVRLGPPLFGLPYRLGRLRYEHGHEGGRLSGGVTGLGNDVTGFLPKAATRDSGFDYEAEIEPDANFQPCAAGSLDEFLLERYTAFTAINCESTRRYFRIWHPPWPQVPVQISLSDTSLLTKNWPWFADAQLVGANYSPGVHNVWMGRPHWI